MVIPFLLIAFMVFYFIKVKALPPEYVIPGFIIFFLACSIVAVALKRKGRLNYKCVIFLVIVTGMMIRLCYFLYTPFDLRTHDVSAVNGHIDYIRYIAENFSLPHSGIQQFYHPPLHHAMSAVVYHVGKIIGLNEFYALRLIQILMIFLSFMSTVFVYKMLKNLHISQAAICIGTLFFTFHPQNIFLSTQINNDNTMLFFVVLTMYLLTKWMNHKTYKNIIWIGLALSCAVLSKKSAFILAVPIGLVFLVEFLKKENRARCKQYLSQYAVLGFVAAPLALSHMLRNYLLFGQGFGYVRQIGGMWTQKRIMLDNSIWDFLTFPLRGFPDSLFVPSKYGAPFVEYAFKSSLFGGWTFDRVKPICMVLAILALIITILIVTQMIRSVKNLFSGNDYIYSVSIIIFFAFAALLKFKLPVGCSEDFRYMSPILLSSAYFIGTFAGNMKASRNKVIRNVLANAVIGIAVSFSVFSIMLVLGAGIR